MATTFKEFISAQYVSDTVAEMYAAPSPAIITAATFSNVGDTVESVTVHIVPPNGSPAGANTVVDAKQLAVGEDYQPPALAGQALDNGSSLHLVASAATAITARVSGIEIT